MGVLKKEQELGNAIQFSDIADEVAGVYSRVMQQGEMDAGAWSGMVAGLINDIPAAGELVERIMAEAEDLIRARLGPLLDQGASTSSPRKSMFVA